MPSGDESRYAIQDLADLADVSRRTVRYYVQEGLTPAPLGVGRGRHYAQAHLNRLLQVKELQAAGRTLDEIRATLVGGAAARPVKPAAASFPDRSIWRRLAARARNRGARGTSRHIARDRTVSANWRPGAASTSLLPPASSDMPTAVVSRPLVGLCTRRSQIPLEHVDVRADITGAHVRVTCTQRYRNQEPQPVEAVYVFPLDEGAAVSGFAAVVAGVRYEGMRSNLGRKRLPPTTMPSLKGMARSASLDEERPDVFTASIGNLASGAQVQIELTYVAELPLEDDSIRFTLPTTVSPRFAPREDQGGIGRPAAEALNPPRSADVPYGLSFTARVATPGRVRRIESPSHPISVELDDDGATVTLAQQQTALDRDLVLLVTPGQPTRSQVVLKTEPGAAVLRPD